MNPEHFDYKQYPDGNMDHRPRYDLGNDDQIAGESAYAAARMALMSAGKLTPEQVIRTSEYTDWSASPSDAASSPDMTTRRNRARKPRKPQTEVKMTTTTTTTTMMMSFVQTFISPTKATTKTLRLSSASSWRRKLEQSIDHETSDVERDDELDDELDDDPWGDGTA